MKLFSSDAIIPAGLAFFAGMGWAYFTVFGVPYWGSIDWTAVGAIGTLLVVAASYYSMFVLPKKSRTHRFSALFIELASYTEVLFEAQKRFALKKEPSTPPEFANTAYQIAIQDLAHLGKGMIPFARNYEVVRRYDANWQKLIEHRKTLPPVLSAADHAHFEEEYTNLRDAIKPTKDAVMECMKILRDNINEN